MDINLSISSFQFIFAFNAFCSLLEAANVIKLIAVMVHCLQMMQEINGFMTLFGIEVDESYNSVPEFLNTFVFWNETIKWHRNDE